MENTISLRKEASLLSLSSLIEVLGGSLLLAVLSQIALPLPFSPVPITMQTFAVFLLAATLGSKKGALAVALYLVQATSGLPVLAGGLVNPLWMLSARAGYLIGFVPAVYLMGFVLEQKKNFLTLVPALLAGQLIIYLFGASVLALFVGAANSFSLGVFPFLIGDLAKICLAASSFLCMDSIKNWLQKRIKR